MLAIATTGTITSGLQCQHVKVARRYPRTFAPDLRLASPPDLLSLDNEEQSGAAYMGVGSFEILIDDTLSAVTSVDELKECLNKTLLSLANDFEDGHWRYPKFQSFLWDNIAETALSHRERIALADKSQSSLVAAAKNLRLTDKEEFGQGSEIAEVFLYGLMKHHFGALPVVPKIFYKQNVQDNAKGADSVHIVVNDEDFTLWFGEAKFYNSIADVRLDAVVSSVMKSLGTDKLKKENSIITNLSDLDELPISEHLTDGIKAALDHAESIDHIKYRINIPILIIHECDITPLYTELSEKYKSEIVQLHKAAADKYYRKQYSNKDKVFKYEAIRFHLILFPVPDKKKIVETFLGAVEFYKAQA
jgi:hypothetical protein